MKRKRLTRRQQAFVNEYLQCWNASEAARRTGSKGKAAWQQAWRMSRDVEVQAAIAERVRERTMAADEILARLAAQARGELPTVIHNRADGKVEVFDMLAALTQIGRHLGLFGQRTSVVHAVRTFGIEEALEKIYGADRDAPDET